MRKIRIKQPFGVETNTILYYYSYTSRYRAWLTIITTTYKKLNIHIFMTFAFSDCFGTYNYNDAKYKKTEKV